MSNKAQAAKQAVAEMVQRGEIADKDREAAMARLIKEGSIATINAKIQAGRQTDFERGVNDLAAGMAKDPRYRGSSEEQIRADAVKAYFRAQPGGQAVSQKAVEDINKTYRVRLATAKDKDKPAIQAQWDAAIANAFDGGGGAASPYGEAPPGAVKPR
jgi:hypothetical protein